MGAIDKTGMLLSSIECVRKTVKWYKKTFFHLIDLCLLHSFSSYEIVTGKHLPLARFHHQLIREKLIKYSTKTISKITNRPRSSDNNILPMRLRHTFSLNCTSKIQ